MTKACLCLTLLLLLEDPFPIFFPNFSKNDYILGRKSTEVCVGTRVQNYNSLKTKTTQSILHDPENIKQHLRRGNLQCYQYKHCTDRWLTQIDPCTLGWTRYTDGELAPLLFNGQQFPDEPMKPAKPKASLKQNPVSIEETPPPPPPQLPSQQRQTSHPQQFSALLQCIFTLHISTVDVTVIRRDLVLTIFRNQFSLYKSFSSYFRILIFILVDRAACWEHLGIICFW